MVNPISLYEMINPYHPTEDQMPASYQQGARPLHDDWLLFKSTPRINTAYRLPMPSKIIAGNAEPLWIPLQAGYPLIPDAQVKDGEYYDGTKTISMRYVLAPQPVHPVGQWSVQAAYINGQWVECFRTSTRKVFGKIIVTYFGLKPDVTLGDFMWWFPEASFSIKNGR